MKKEIIFIGTGPANIFALIKLLKGGYKGKILLIEKGKGPYDRQPNEVINGWFGAGTYSDCKIILSTIAGGTIAQYLTPKMIEELDKEFINILLEFHPELPIPIESDREEFLHFENQINLVIHVGTDYSRIVGKKIYDWISTFKNVELKFGEEVSNIEYRPSEKFIYKIKTNLNSYEGNFVVLGTGKSGITLSKQITEDFKIKLKPKPIQIGIRVEVPFEITQHLTDKYYDFKLKLKVGDIEVRSFCVSPKGEVIEENQYNNITYNGGSYKDKKTDKTNFGIICSFQPNENSFQLQRKIVSNFNKLDRQLLNGISFNQFMVNSLYKEIFSKEIHYSLYEWMTKFENICPGFLSSVKIYVPEVKYSTDIFPLDKSFQLEKYPDFFIIGDTSISRGIYQSVLSGLHVGNILLKR